MNEEMMILHIVSSDGLLPQKDLTEILFNRFSYIWGREDKYLGHYISLAADSFSL